MHKIYTLLFLLCFILFGTLSYAQTSERYFETERMKQVLNQEVVGVKVTQFVLRKIDDKKRVYEFTADDMTKVEQLMRDHDGVLAFQSHVLDKTINVISQNTAGQPELFNHLKVAEQLSQNGYFVIGLRAGYDNLLPGKGCKSVKSKTPTSTNSVVDVAAQTKTPVTTTTSQPTNETIDADCEECKKVNLSKEALEKLKNASYEGETIDFDFGSSDDPK